MNRTEVIRPCHSRSSNITGAVRVLIVELSHGIGFAANEWKLLQTGVSVALREPSVLCVCDMAGDRLHKDTLHASFSVVNSQHGSGNVPVMIRNLTRLVQKSTNVGPNCLEHVIFALKLEHVPTLDSLLNRVTVRKHEDKKVSPAKVSKPSPRRRRLLRLSCDNVRWFTSEKDTKCAILPIDLKDIFDHKRVTGVNIITISDPYIVLQETQLQKGTSIMFLYLTYPLKQGYAPPSSVTAMISLEKTKPSVCFKHGTESFLEKIEINGFVLKPHRALRVRQNTTFTITSGAVYTSETHSAVFLPYNIPGLDIHVVPWRANDTLSIAMIAVEDISIPAKTPLGEIRFFSHSLMRLGPERKEYPSSGQITIEAHGPEMYASTDLLNDRELDIHNVTVSRRRNNDNDIEQDSEEEEEQQFVLDEDGEVDIAELDLASVTSEERNQLLGLSDDDNDENDEESGDEGTSAGATHEWPEMNTLQMFAHYREHATGPVPTDRTVAAARLGKKQRMENMVAANENEEEEFEYNLKLKLKPIDIRFTEAALSDFSFWLPVFRFNRKTGAFHHTFLHRPRDVLKFQGLRAIQVASSKNASQENRSQPMRT